MEFEDSDYYITFRRGFTKDDAKSALMRLATDEGLRATIQSGPDGARAGFRELGIELGYDLVPDDSYPIVLPGRGEFLKVIREIEKKEAEEEYEVEFTLLPFGVYVPGRRPFPGLLLLAAKASGSGP